MTFKQIIRFDLRNGILRKKRFWFVVPLILSLCLQGSSVLQQGREMGRIHTQAAWLDYVMFCLKGCMPYETGMGDSFYLPITWLMLMIGCLLMSLDYPEEQLHGMGKQLLLYSYKRERWWLSKCLWNILCTFYYFFLMLFSCFVYGLLTGSILTFCNMPEVTQIFCAEAAFELVDDLNISVLQLLFSVIVLPALSMAALSMVQMVLSLYIKPIFSFIAVTVLLLFSAYSDFPFLTGNYAMVMRSSCTIQQGFDMYAGIEINLIILIAAVLTGKRKFQSYDIMV